MKRSIYVQSSLVIVFLLTIFLQISMAQGRATSAEPTTQPNTNEKKKNNDTPTPPTPTGTGTSSSSQIPVVTLLYVGDDKPEEPKVEPVVKTDNESVSTTDWIENFFIQESSSKIIMIRNNSKTRWIKITSIFLHSCENVAIKCNPDGSASSQGGGWTLSPGAIGAFVPTMSLDAKKPMVFQYYYNAEFVK